MRFDLSYPLSTRIAEFIGFFIPLNIFLTLFWFISGSHIAPLSTLGASLSFVIINALFFVYFLVRWSHVQGGETIFQGLQQGITTFGRGVSTLVNGVLLFIVYLLGIGLTALIAKLFRKHFLTLKQPPVSSYYLPKETTTHKDHYYRQF